jgi:hypothetical protein
MSEVWCGWVDRVAGDVRAVAVLLLERFWAAAWGRDAMFYGGVCAEFFVQCSA